MGSKKQANFKHATRRWHVRRGDEVVVVAGEDRGKRGKILSVDRRRGRVVVEGVNRHKVHMKPSQQAPQGGVVERELAIDISNVQAWDATNQKPTRIGKRELNDGSRVRVARTSGEALEA